MPAVASFATGYKTSRIFALNQLHDTPQQIIRWYIPFGTPSQISRSETPWNFTHFDRGAPFTSRRKTTDSWQVHD